MDVEETSREEENRRWKKQNHPQKEEAIRESKVEIEVISREETG